MTLDEYTKFTKMALAPKDAWTDEDLKTWILLNQKYQDHWRATHVRICAKEEPSFVVHVKELKYWKSLGFFVVTKGGRT